VPPTSPLPPMAGLFIFPAMNRFPYPPQTETARDVLNVEAAHTLPHSPEPPLFFSVCPRTACNAVHEVWKNRMSRISGGDSA
jgi:hypothetical protein